MTDFYPDINCEFGTTDYGICINTPMTKCCLNKEGRCTGPKEFICKPCKYYGLYRPDFCPRTDATDKEELFRIIVTYNDRITKLENKTRML